MKMLFAIVINALAFMATAYIVPGFEVSNLTTAFLATIVLAVVNTFIKPILSFISLPLTILTLGLFTFIVNAAILFVVSWVVPGFTLTGWIPAILGAIVLSVVATLLNSFLKGVGKSLK